MRKILLITIALFTTFSASAQKTDTVKECDFLGKPYFKNGKATIVIKVTYKEFYRSGDEPLFTALDKKNKLRSSDYFTRCCGGSAIAFIPENCSKKYSGVMIQKRMDFDIDKAKPGDTLFLTCIVYEGEKNYDKSPFFTVNNISLKKTRKRK